MKSYSVRIFVFCFALAIFAGTLGFAQQPPPQQQPASAAGNWTLYCKDPNGSTSTKYLNLQQNGTAITGHFKGPNQSGGVGRQQSTTSISWFAQRLATSSPFADASMGRASKAWSRATHTTAPSTTAEAPDRSRAFAQTSD